MNGRVPCSITEALFDKKNAGQRRQPEGGTPSTLPSYHVLFDRHKRPKRCYHCGSIGIEDIWPDGSHETGESVCVICSRAQCYWTGR